LRCFEILASRIGRSGADRPQRADAIKGMDGCLGETLPGSLLTAERSPHRNRFMKASQGRVSLIIRFFQVPRGFIASGNQVFSLLPWLPI
jgi:hypothetical protein